MEFPFSQFTLGILLIMAAPHSVGSLPFVCILTQNNLSHSLKLGSMQRKASQKVTK